MIKIVELFSGIGSQTQALKNKNIPHKVVGISEWSINSIISYGEIHSDNTDYNVSRSEILNELKDFTFSLDTKKPYNINKLKDDKLYLLYKNHKNSNNFGSIVDMRGSQIENIDILTYSFPCQNLSNQGKQEGLYEGKSSSLLWQVGRLIDEVKIKPKVLLMENVSAILNDRHKEGFNYWKDFLSKNGYKNYVLKLKASKYGVPQNRERCFMISSLIDMNGIIEDITKNEKLTDLRIKDILDPVVDYKYTKNSLLTFLPEDLQFNNTYNGVRSIELVNYSNFKSDRRVFNRYSISPTLTATGANSTIKIYDENNIRILNPNECWRLMGFTDKEFNKVKHIHKDIELVKQAGNSIVVNVLETIFENINKYIGNGKL